MYRPAGLWPRGSAPSRRLLGVVSASLGFAALVLGSGIPRATPASPESAWQGGQYRDSRNPDRGGAPRDAVAPTRSTKGSITVAQTAVQRPRLSPGESMALRAIYEVASPTDVRETRVIRYDGLVLSRLERVVSRPAGSVESEYRVNVPKDAVEGWYSVTTIVEPTRATTRSGGADQKETGFYVERTGAKESADAQPAPTAPSAPADEVTVKLWANQTKYRIGDRMSLGFATNRDAYVTLVNVGTSGEVTILFPNRFSGSHGVKGGTTYTVPEVGDSYELELKGPPGVELVYALVTLKPVAFLPTDFQSTGRVFHTVTDRSSTFTRDINVMIKSIPLREQAKAMVELDVAR
jgi:hypothetical protein